MRISFIQMRSQEGPPPFQGPTVPMQLSSAEKWTAKFDVNFFNGRFSKNWFFPGSLQEQDLKFIYRWKVDWISYNFVIENFCLVPKNGPLQGPKSHKSSKLTKKLPGHVDQILSPPEITPLFSIYSKKKFYSGETIYIRFMYFFLLILWFLVCCFSR